MSLYDKIAPYLHDGTPGHKGSHYICVAISDAAVYEKILRNAGTDLRRRIANRLGYGDTVQDWLHRRGHLEDLKPLPLTQRRQQVQAFRHRWLEHLCKEYENEISVRQNRTMPQ